MRHVKMGIAALVMVAIAGTATNNASAQSVVEVGRDRIKDTALTLYSDGQSLIRERRGLAVDGADKLRIVGLPHSTHEDSIRLRQGKAPLSAISLYRGNLSPQSLMDAAVGKEMTWIATNPQTGEEREIKGRLLSHRNGVLIDTGARVEVAPPGRLALDTLPEGIIDGVAVEASATDAGTMDEIGIHYIAGGLAWRADYTGHWDEKAETLRLSGHYAISNTTRRDYPNATLRLVAGRINRASPTPFAKAEQGRAVAELSTLRADAAAPAPPEEIPVGNLHVYNIDGVIDLPAGKTIRRPLFDHVTISAKKRYTLSGSGSVHPHQPRIDPSATVFHPTRELIFKTGKEAGLDRILPAGPIRIFASDEAETGAGLVVGEAHVPHTAKGGSVELSLGPAMDIEVRRTLTDYRETGPATQRGEQPPYQATHRIVVRNASDKPVTLSLTEQFDGEWEILESNIDFSRPNATQAGWEISVEAGKEVALTYQVQIKP